MAKAIMWFCIVLYVILGIVRVFADKKVTIVSILAGIGIMIVGFILSWIGSFFLVGFGKIVNWVEHPFLENGTPSSRAPEKEDFFTRTMECMAAKREQRRAKKETERRILNEWYAQQGSGGERPTGQEESTIKMPKYKCPKCGERLEHGAEQCPVCGQSIKWREEI